MRLKLYHTNYR